MKIRFTQINEGSNQLYFEHNFATLGLHESEERLPNPIHVNVDLNKVGSQFFLNVVVDTVASFTCDRCLEKFDQQIKDKFKLVYSIEKTYYPESADRDFRVITSETEEIDLSDDIRESLLLAVPMKIICSEECKGLCPQCGINLNLHKCEHDNKPIDPRWEVLTKLQNTVS